MGYRWRWKEKKNNNNISSLISALKVFALSSSYDYWKYCSKQTAATLYSTWINDRVSNTFINISWSWPFLKLTSFWLYPLTLPMLRLLSSKAQWRNDFWKPSKPCHVGIRWDALAEYFQMSTHMLGFQFSGFLHHFVLAKLATTSIRV